MKCLHIFLLFFLISIYFKFSLSARIKLPAADKKADEEVISDKELDTLLKDPKYAALAGDLMKTETLPSSTKSTTSSHYMSSSYKDHLDRISSSKGKSKLLAQSQKVDLDSIDLLGKSLTSDPLKDLDLLAGAKKEDDKKNDKKNEVEDKFKSFDFISKQQARFLIEILKQPVFFNMLSAEAQQIVKV
jgi:hypothetical protein